MIAGLRTYPETRGSEVPWLGTIPRHWRIRRLRNVCDIRVSNVDKHSRDHEEPVRLCNYVDVYKNDHIRSGMAFMRATATKEEIARFRLQPGDVLVTKDSEAWTDIGVPALVRQSGDDIICGYHLALLRPSSEVLEGGYLFRVLQSQCVAYQFHVAAKGVTRYGLSHGAIKSMRLPLPPVVEQNGIVRFLDHVNHRIRRYIGSKQKLIALLEEQEQAIVHQAVTGKIDVRTGEPYPAYNESGVEWLGGIPARWKAVRFSRVIKNGPKNGISPPISEDGTLRSFAISAIRSGTVDVRDRDLKIVSHIDTRIASAYSLCAGDLLLVRGNGNLRLVGRAGVVEQPMDGWIYPDLLMRVRLTETALPRFVVALLNSGVGRRQIESIAHTAVGTFKVNNHDVRRLWLALPDLCEQRDIVNHITKATSICTQLKKRTRLEIETVQEYRNRLIADVVTGKLDVREAVAQLAEVGPHEAESDSEGTLPTYDGVGLDDLDTHSDRAEA